MNKILTLKSSQDRFASNSICSNSNSYFEDSIRTLDISQEEYELILAYRRAINDENESVKIIVDTALKK